MTLYDALVLPFASFSFMRLALVACLALSLANGPLGTMLVLRRMSLDGDVLSHAVMPGAALGFLYAGHSLFALSFGGLLSGLAVAALAGLLARVRPIRSDTSLVAFYLVALSLGVMLVAWRGSNVDVMRVLFGTVLAIDARSLVAIAAVSSVTLVLLAAIYRPLAVDSFDPLFLRTSGGGSIFRGLFVALVLLDLVVSFQAFGTLLAIGPMLLPAAAARLWTDRVGVMAALATIFGMLAGTAGLLISYHANLPSGPAIVLGAGLLYGFSLALAALWRRSHRKIGMGRIACFVLSALVSVAAVPRHGYGGEKLRVVATFSVIADLAANVGGDHIGLDTLVGPGGDSELFQPTAADAATVARANVVLMNGLNDAFEPWLDNLLRQAKFAGTKVIVSRGVRALSADDEHPASHATPVAAVLDQHAWLDPRNALIYTSNIALALARADPANADGYRARAAAYGDRLKALDIWAHQQMAAVPTAKRRALASHDSMQYLAHAFAITLISVNGWTNKSEPSAADLARLTRQIDKERVRALYLDSITDPRAMERIGRETGATIGGTLYGDSLSAPDGEAATYIQMIRHDIDVLKAGMLRN